MRQEYKDYPVQKVLELACAALKYNSGYFKKQARLDKKLVHANKKLVLYALASSRWDYEFPNEVPPLVSASEADKAFASEIIEYLKINQLNDSDFWVRIVRACVSGRIAEDEIGFIAALPASYKKLQRGIKIEEMIKTFKQEYIGEINEVIEDLPCTVLEAVEAKSFKGYNIFGVIEEYPVSWSCPWFVKAGPVTIKSALIRDHGRHWRYETVVTRLAGVRFPGSKSEPDYEKMKENITNENSNSERSASGDSIPWD